jgi:hypothetical protein
MKGNQENAKKLVKGERKRKRKRKGEPSKLELCFFCSRSKEKQLE